MRKLQCDYFSLPLPLPSLSFLFFLILFLFGIFFSASRIFNASLSLFLCIYLGEIHWRLIYSAVLPATAVAKVNSLLTCGIALDYLSNGVRFFYFGRRRRLSSIARTRHIATGPLSTIFRSSTYLDVAEWKLRSRHRILLNIKYLCLNNNNIPAAGIQPCAVPLSTASTLIFGAGAS